jgi:hypothetical protein
MHFFGDTKYMSYDCIFKTPKKSSFIEDRSVKKKKELSDNFCTAEYVIELYITFTKALFAHQQLLITKNDLKAQAILSFAVSK